MKHIFIILNIIILLSGCASNNQALEIKKTNKEKELEKQNKLLDKEIKKLKKENDEKVEQQTEPKVIIKEKTKIVVVEKPVTNDSKIVVGATEYVYIPLLDLTLKARVDTGATTTSLHALDIKEFERDGEKWVKFKFENSKGKLTDWSLPVERIVSIKRHGMKNQQRYVVKIRINLGKISQLVDVSLTNREKFSYSALIGRNFLNGYAVVDVSKKYVTKPIKK
ncbi:ATP-dependent zinc protease [Campylobacterota bacterium DY0563]